MSLWIDKRTPELSLPPKLSVANLKLCPLCDSLNARSNSACFVCGWQGKFIHDSRQVHTGLVLLMEQCPELSDGVRASLYRPPLLARLMEFVRRKLTRQPKIDIWA